MGNQRSIICFLMFLMVNSKIYAASTSPSQTVPKVFEEIEKEKIKKRDGKQLLNGLDNIKTKKEELEQISVTVSSLVIIASKELQNIISFDNYKKQLIGKSKSINELNLIAKKMTKDYQSKEFPLVRVILPKQELKPDGATIFFKVIDGFIEKN